MKPPFWDEKNLVVFSTRIPDLTPPAGALLLGDIYTSLNTHYIYKVIYTPEL